MNQRPWRAYAILYILAAALTALYIYAEYHRRRRIWAQVPPNMWEQIAAQMRYGKGTPLDARQVLADVDAWLSEGAGR